LRQEITLENLFVLFIFHNSTDNFDGNKNRTPIITQNYKAQLLYTLSGMNYVWKSGTACIYTYNWIFVSLLLH